MRFPFAQERIDALLRIGGDRVLRHHLRHPLIGLGQGQLTLFVERRLAYGNCSRRGGRDRARQLQGRGLELLVGHEVGDETEAEGILGGEELTGQQHPHRRLRRHRAGEGDHRRRAEQADLHPGSGEPCRTGRHREIASGHQLTTSRRGHPLNLGDDRLRDRLNGLHQLGTGGEGRLLGLEIRTADLLEVMTGTEHVPRGPQDHCAHIGPPPHLGEGVAELCHHGPRQRIAGFGLVDRHGRDAVVGEE